MLEASREIGLEINTEKTMYMVVSHHQSLVQLTIYWLVINPSKLWQSSNTWEQQ
jgi:hypothetical protein